ncbi:MAG: immunoglobulin domain-containing protein, partial [Verrucomicrobiia bacterium]
MKHVFRGFLVIATLVGLATPSHAVVILDDTWADGNRNNTSLPTNAAWYASSGSALTATTGSMTLANGSSAILAVSYFTTNPAAPVQLGIGDTLVTTLNLSLTGVAAQNSSQGFRLGLFYFGSNRVSADFSGNNTQGAGVPGYALFGNMGATFNNANPIGVMKRTTISDSALLGTSGDWTTLTNGPGNISNFPGFASVTNYVLQITLQRTDTSSLAVTISWLNSGNGASLTTSFTDTGAANFSFDGIGLRPSGSSSTAATIIFSEAKVEYIPGATAPSITEDVQDQQVLVSQTASFSVLASGTLPLFYQWYYNTNSLLTNATSSSLTITNAQLTDAGDYSVVVSNTYGVVTSSVAQLSVSTPDAPTIITQPQDQTVSPGDSAVFTVEAGGSEPLSYQWYYNTNTLVDGATDSTLTLTNVQPGQAGVYSVIVSNLAGTITSSNAMLNVNTNPAAPVFTSEPASQVVLAGSTVTLTASASGTAPISYQWYTNNVPISGATSPTLTLVSVQTSADGSYTVTASNSVGVATSDPAQLTVTASVYVPNSAYNLTGFASGTTGGGVLADTDPNYAKVYTATDLANALNSKTVKVIEIMNDLNLGYNEIEASAKATSEPFRAGETPLLHPVLLVTGESDVDIQKKNGLTIFSANGWAIHHCKFNIKNCSNIIIRNLKFDQLWEWDESTKGQYDRNDWDFITLGDGGAVSNIWVDHCTFTKSYDGNLDTKAGCSGITISWCNYVGDDGATNPNSWVWQQINSLESNKSSYAMYNFLRTNGYSTTNIVTIMQAHDKTHLAGQNDLDPDNATISMTFHHLHLGVWDRCVPRLRAGNVHDYNLYVDDTLVLAAKRLRDSIAATMSTANQNTLNNTYSFDPPVNGTISTESGAILVEKSVYIDCLYPLRNNQTDPSNPEYTGKIMALDSIYHFDNTDGSTTDYRGDSTNATGFADFGPAQAPVIAFSWNLTGNQLPYTYYPDDPAQLQAIVTSPTAGAGAGVLTWNKTNWLVTSYAPTAPIITASPQGLTVTNGQSASFTVVAGGSAPLTYQWYFNTSSPVSGATNATFSITSVQSTNLGPYFAIVNNTAGSATSAVAVLQVSSGCSVGAAGSISGPIAVCPGQTGLNYSISSVGGATTYAWTVPSDATITGGQGPTSIIVTWGSTAGNVTVTPSAGGCTGNGSSLSVAVNAAPGILSGPSPQAACDGGSANFTVSASGAGLSYQWQENGSNISDGGTIGGSGTSTLTLTGVGTGDSGASFDCVVSGTCSPPATSGAATLTVNAAPAAFNVTGGGSYCAASGGVTVGLDGSESTADYLLELNDTPTGTLVAGTGSALAFSNQTAVGTYTVIASNVTSGCTATMNGNASVTPVDPFTCWEQIYGITNCAVCDGNSSYTGDGMSNTNKFLAGFNPTNAAAYLHVISVAEANGTNIVVTYLGANGDSTSPLGSLTYTNILDYTTGTANGSYSNIN